jgi:peptidoglycan/LPS O-acetylase OafA/YrhL
MIEHPRLSPRPHIQGLRAIAVLGVVLFHFGAAWLPGGFVGVDVFFLISGFLISGSIYREIEVGRFRLADFFERRMRRILPAFFVVTVTSSFAAYFLLFPNELVSYAYSVAAAALFGSNIYFNATANYFAPIASEIPLIHYWSLSVEEQFYLVFPLLILAIYRINKRAVLTAISAAFIVSLVGGEIALRTNPQAAFYLLPFRAFEFLIGCALARGEMRSTTNSSEAACSTALGASLIVLCMIFMTERTRFPGLERDEFRLRRILRF